MPRIHDIDVSRLTRLGQLIDAYAQRQRPRLSTISAIASAIGVRPNTAKSLLYSEHEPSPRTLRKVIERTGIPAATIYAAIMPTPPPAVETFAPPMPRPITHRQVEALTRPQLAEHTPNTALDEAIARIRATEHPAMAEVMVQALLERAGRQDPRAYWQMRIEEAPPWDDHDAVSTLQMQTVSPARTVTTDEPQADSQPAGARS